jgi:ABC-type transporter Mla maintaining outer membrane lipid asymmetry permease subunit MlaE
VIAKRLVMIGVAIVFVGAFRALEADGVEEALGDCVAAAVVATLLTWATAP